MAITLPNTYNTYVPLDTLLASQLNSDNANNSYMADNFPITSYSTSEVETEAKWTDGRTIYKKTIALGTLPNATSKTYALGIPAGSIVIRHDSFARTTDGRAIFPLPFVSDIVSQTVSFYFSTLNASPTASISVGVDRTEFVATTTIYYVKPSA